MKLYGTHSLATVLPVMRQILPPALLRQFAQEASRGNYERSVEFHQLFTAMLGALICRLPNRERVVDRFSHLLNTTCPGTLGYNLKSDSFVCFLHLILAHLEKQLPVKAGKRLALSSLDSMPLLVPITQRGKAPKYNRFTKGICLQWALNLTPRPGQLLVSLKQIIPGAGNDSFRVRLIELVKGVWYLMDRGFYSIRTIEQWLEESISFLVRAKIKDLQWTVIRTLGKPGELDNGLTLDGDDIVWLGSPKRKNRPQVRLIRAWLPRPKTTRRKKLKNVRNKKAQKQQTQPKREDLFLVTSDFRTSARKLLARYRLRHQVEVYHRFLKQSLGLSHIFGFNEAAMEVMALLAVIATNLLWLRDKDPESVKSPEQVVSRLSELLKQLRRELDVEEPQRRNISVSVRKEAKSKARAPT